MAALPGESWSVSCRRCAILGNASHLSGDPAILFGRDRSSSSIRRIETILVVLRMFKYVAHKNGLLFIVWPQLVAHNIRMCHRKLTVSPVRVSLSSLEPKRLAMKSACDAQPERESRIAVREGV